MNVTKVGRFLYPVLSCLLVLGFAEGLMRTFWSGEIDTPRARQTKGMREVPSRLSAAIMPNYKFKIVDTHFSIPVNKWGYRGRDFEKEKPSDVFRIMVYGSSPVFDPNMSHLHDWPSEVATLLNAQAKSYEVINAGMPGHQITDSLGRFIGEGHLFSPDAVIIYHAYTDLKQFSREDHFLRRAVPACRLCDPLWSYQNVFDQFLGQRSHFYSKIRSSYFTWSRNLGEQGPGAGKDF